MNSYSLTVITSFNFDYHGVRTNGHTQLPGAVFSIFHKTYPKHKFIEKSSFNRKIVIKSKKSEGY